MKDISWRSRASKVAGSVLPVLLASSCSEAGEAPAPVDRATVGVAREHRGVAPNRHLGADDRLGELLNHPAFQGFSRRMLPSADTGYDEAMPLRKVGSLLPYHTHVDPDEVVASLNRMVDDVGAGHTVFYDIYTDAQKKAEPALRDTGLFFFRGKPGAPFAVIAPGGGFSYVGSVHEGFPYADVISKHGFNAFVLKYRTGRGGGVATEDLAAALGYIVENAKTLRVGEEDYSLWGSSAGARMAAAIGSHGARAFGGPSLSKPRVVVMAYTGHSEVTAVEPSTFVVVGETDGIAPPAVMESRIAALRRIGTPVEYHRFPRLGHGFGSGRGTSAQGWLDEAVRFWRNENTKARRG